MKTLRKRTTALLLVFIAALTLYPSLAFAAVTQEQAMEYLVQCGIFQGDENGNLNIDKGLTRAELAVVLTRRDLRRDFGEKTGDINAWYAENVPNGTQPHKFTDVPAWAVPHVAYCYAKGYMNGISETRFDPNSQVNPKMVCTVIMRHLKLPETDWNYDTSVAKAQSIRLTEDANVSGTTIKRGDTAIILYRAINGHYTKASTIPTPTPTTTPSATTAMTIEEMRTELIRLINVERENAGLNPVEVLPALMDCAQAKAQDFNDNNYFAHNSPKYGTPTAMVKSFVKNADGVGEVIAQISTIYPKVIVDVWMSSKLHKAVLLDADKKYIGVGVVKTTNVNSKSAHNWVAQFTK
jgi:uncharacterized protein YkwD